MKVIIIGVIVVAKFAIPVLIVRFPFAAGWANFVLDTVDGDLLIPLGLEDGPYQLIDKAADWCTYVGMVFVAREWTIKRTIVALFVFRTVGQLLFFITGEEIIFFFPNFLEPLFLIYATIRISNPSGSSTSTTATELGSGYLSFCTNCRTSTSPMSATSTEATSSLVFSPDLSRPHRVPCNCRLVMSAIKPTIEHEHRDRWSSPASSGLFD